MQYDTIWFIIVKDYIYIVIKLLVYLRMCLRLHFTSKYTLYNYYVTNKETLNLEPWDDGKNKSVSTIL